MTFKKTFRIFTSAVLFSLFVFISCNDDSEIIDNSTPNVAELNENISSAPGIEFVIKGKLSDDKGIQSINISYDKWYLNKTILLEENPVSFDLNYKFLVPENETPESEHNIKITLTDIGGNETSKNIKVKLDFDVIKPEIKIIAPASGTSFKSGDNIDLNVQVSDNKAIDSIIVSSAKLNYVQKLKLNNVVTSYNFLKTIAIPNQGVTGDVLFELIAIDKTGNRTKKSITINVGPKDIFQNIYAVGGSVWGDWDPSKATKMWVNPIDDKWFVLEFYYRANRGIKFIGQLGWSPNNWGLDPNDPSKMINAQNSAEIKFPEGEGYYHLEFNPYTLNYKYQKMTVDIPIKNNMYLMGKGFEGYNLNWNPADAIPMVKDPNGNPYVFTINIRLSNDVDLKFIGQTNGWGPFDCGFESGGEKIIPVNYVKCKSGDGSADLKFKNQAGLYTITIDYFLLRATILEKN